MLLRSGLEGEKSSTSPGSASAGNAESTAALLGLQKNVGTLEAALEAERRGRQSDEATHAREVDGLRGEARDAVAAVEEHRAAGSQVKAEVEEQLKREAAQLQVGQAGVPAAGGVGGGWSKERVAESLVAVW